MSNTTDLEPVQFLRESDAQPLGVAEATAHERLGRVAASLEKLRAELARRGMSSPEQLAAVQARQERALAAVKAAGITAETHPPEVIDLAVERALRQGREAADVATTGSDAMVLRAQFGSPDAGAAQQVISPEDYRNAA